MHGFDMGWVGFAGDGEMGFLKGFCWGGGVGQDFAT